MTTDTRPQLRLNETKLPWHYERVEAWEAGQRIAPISVDMALTRACQAACRGCFAVLQESQTRSNITVDHAKTLLDDFAEIGVKAVSLVSDGESTLSPAYAPFIEHAADLGIDVGNATNGWLLMPELAERVLPHMKWVRFTVLAGKPESYTRMMHPDPERMDVFWTAMHNISEAVRIKRRKNLDVTLGIQTFVTPDDADEIRAFAQLGLDLGVDYVLIKHFSDDEYGSYSIQYQDYGAIEDALRQAEAMSNERTQVIVRWNKIEDGNKPPYKRMWACPFLLQVSGSGLVAPSGMFFNARYSKLHIGDFTQERFIDIWRSQRYWDCMNYLASPYFDAAKHMGTLPIQFAANVMLDRHVKGIERMQPATGEPPLHVNFV